MKRPKFILQILNVLNGLLLFLYFFKVMHYTSFLGRIEIMHLIIAAFIIYGIKSWIEVKTNTADPIKNNKTTNILFLTGFTIFVLGIAVKFMHWPFANLFMLAGVIIVNLSYWLSFFISANSLTPDTEILDDFEHE
ncbi:hypothetical protein DNU06_13540 [Putridiphycobacter roseus]|uniref:Uncharacterized protein n=1 Tax=Putridiphycobacter roseus TaxID=2219161 RepID=A0A2W1N093_9FLAO|nr:hypothetical protein [Putridiphycobacter roseus]PZE16331.1 hypothetical protein DNU06_13540 [Putridiphycobacter roseus]